jgi:hypothetical protein
MKYQKLLFFYLLLGLLFVSLNSCRKNASSDSNAINNDPIVEEVKTTITEFEAEDFMQTRCHEVNQTLMKKKTIIDHGIKKFYFMSAAENGEACISIISEEKLEISYVDCGEVYSKIAVWNSF